MHKDQREKAAVLVIGVTSFETMSREDAMAYAVALARDLTDLRKRGVPDHLGLHRDGSE